MTVGNLLALSPEWWLLAGAAVVFAVARLRPEGSGAIETGIALLALAGSLGALATQARATITLYEGVFIVDAYTVYLGVVILLAAALSLTLNLAEAARETRQAGAFAGFALVATLGAMLMASSADLASLFVATELLSVNVALMAFVGRRDQAATRSAVGWLAIGLPGSAALLFGLALLYGLAGSTSLRAVGTALAGQDSTTPAVVLALALVVAGFGVKLGLAPFHWALPVLNSGAPVPVLAFAGSAGAAAGFGLFARVTQWTFASSHLDIAVVLAVLAAVSMTVGTVAAIGQTSVRGLLAYTAVAQAGYGVAALAVLPHGGIGATLLFIVALAFGVLTVFGAIAAWRRMVDSDRLGDLSGMWSYAPALALVLSLGLASLIGLPPMVGFFARVAVLQAAVQGGFSWLAVIGLVNTILSAVPLVRLVRIIVVDPPAYAVEPIGPGRPAAVAVGLTTTVLVVLIGFLGPLSAAAGFAVRALLR